MFSQIFTFCDILFKIYIFQSLRRLSVMGWENPRACFYVCHQLDNKQDVRFVTQQTSERPSAGSVVRRAGPFTSFVPKPLLLGKCLAGAELRLSNKLLLSSKPCLHWQPFPKKGQLVVETGDKRWISEKDWGFNLGVQWEFPNGCIFFLWAASEATQQGTHTEMCLPSQAWNIHTKKV